VQAVRLQPRTVRNKVISLVLPIGTLGQRGGGMDCRRDFRTEAARVRALAESMGRSDMRQLALEIASLYEKMARQAEILAVIEGEDGAPEYERPVQRGL
jgi:hypothetical protein